MYWLLSIPPLDYNSLDTVCCIHWCLYTYLSAQHIVGTKYRISELGLEKKEMVVNGAVLVNNESGSEVFTSCESSNHLCWKVRGSLCLDFRLLHPGSSRGERLMTERSRQNWTEKELPVGMKNACGCQGQGGQAQNSSSSTSLGGTQSEWDLCFGLRKNSQKFSINKNS